MVKMAAQAESENGVANRSAGKGQNGEAGNSDANQIDIKEGDKVRNTVSGWKGKVTNVTDYGDIHTPKEKGVYIKCEALDKSQGQRFKRVQLACFRNGTIWEVVRDEA